MLRHCDEALRLSPRDPLLLWYLPKGWAALNAESGKGCRTLLTQMAQVSEQSKYGGEGGSAWRVASNALPVSERLSPNTMM